MKRNPVASRVWWIAGVGAAALALVGGVALAATSKPAGVLDTLPAKGPFRLMQTGELFQVGQTYLFTGPNGDVGGALDDIKAQGFTILADYPNRKPSGWPDDGDANQLRVVATYRGLANATAVPAKLSVWQASS